MRTATSVNRQNGFSLIEVVFATAILSIVSYAALTSSDLTRSRMKTAHHRIAAAELGQFVIDQLLVAADTDSRLIPGTHTRYFNAEAAVVSFPNQATFVATWVITESNPIPGVIRIEITVEPVPSAPLSAIQFTTYRQINQVGVGSGSAASSSGGA